MNEPQLSAEMEKRFDDLVENKLFQGKDSEGYVDIYDYIEDDLPKLKHLLATALEEERKKVLSEVEGWLVKSDEYPDPDGIIGYHNEKIAELRAKLNQLKGTDVTN